MSQNKNDELTKTKTSINLMGGKRNSNQELTNNKMWKMTIARVRTTSHFAQSAVEWKNQRFGNYLRINGFLPLASEFISYQ